MGKIQRVTIRKANPHDKYNTHYTINLNGRGMTMAHTKEEAKWKADKLRMQVHRRGRR